MTRRQKRIFWSWFWRIAIIIIAGLLIAIAGNQQSIMVDNAEIKTMQNDTLDQIMLMQLDAEMDRLAPDPWEEWDKDVIQDSTGPTSTYQLTPEERVLIERIVMSESSLEGLEAQMAVAQTIYDRMNDFGDSLPIAIQTYSTRDNGAPTDSVKLAISNVFDKGMRIYEGGTYQFHDDTVLPYWTEGKIARGSIGRLSFYGGYAD